MKKKLIALILLSSVLTFSVALAWNHTFVAGSTVASGDYSHILFWANAESGTVDQDANYTTNTANGEYPNSQTGTDTSQITIKSDQYKTGSQSFYAATSNDYYSFSVSSDDIADDSQGTVCFWFRVNTWASSAAIMRIDVSAGGYAIIRLSDTDEIAIRYNDGAVSSTICTTDAANLAVDTWYWVEFQWNDSANTRRLIVYNDALSELDNELESGAFSWSDFSTVSVGQYSSAGAVAWTDQIIITNRTTGETEYANTASSPR